MAESPASTSKDTASVQIGIDGHYRVGSWTGVRVDKQLDFTSIETRDGDGVQVRYRPDSSTQASKETSTQWVYVKAGSEAAPLVVYRDGKAVLSTRFPTAGSPSRQPSMIPLQMRWVLVLGDSLGVDEIGVNELLGRDSTIAVTTPSSVDSMPASVLGLDGIDLMIINSAGIPLLKQLSSLQQRALARWITEGGRVLLTLGEATEELLEAAPWLAELLPLDRIETVTLDPAAIETYTSSQTPLQQFVGIRLPKDAGKVRIMGRTRRRVSAPVASQFNVGFGRIDVVAADLESSAFANWPERMDLITRLTESMLVTENRPQDTKSRATAYDDLAGQLRSTLDQFKIQRSMRFSVISLLLMALVAAIGPLDYLLINRVLGRPLLGWLSFPIMAIGLSALLAWQSRLDANTSAAPLGQSSTVSSDSIRCNRIEIIDIDSMASFGRAQSVNYLYAHEAALFDIAVAPTQEFRSFTDEMSQSLLSPFGYPGQSFGGIQIAIEDARLPAYEVPFTESEAGWSSTLTAVPLAPRSSKGFSSEMLFQPELKNRLRIQRRAGSELLQGELSNPLPVDLLDGMLIFRNWVYLLPTRFPSGGRIGSLDSLRQKNFRWLLSRQKALESSVESESWDPAARNSLSRVAEMLMFHQAVGGTGYTKLQNEPLGNLDLSHALADDRCILVGRLPSDVTNVVVQNHELSMVVEGDHLTMVRVVFPVETTRRR